MGLGSKTIWMKAPNLKSKLVSETVPSCVYLLIIYLCGVHDM